jgi:L-seryl-tRNA(Ser) seleniumtransferase
MMRRTGDELRGRAERLATDLRDRSVGVEVTTVSGFSEMGSGSLPTQGLATTLVAIAPGRIGADTLAKRLRLYAPPIFARIQEDRVLIDPRTLLDGDERIIVEAVAEALGRTE